VALAANNVWAVRERRVSTGAARLGEYRGVTLIEHWDGTSWRLVHSPDATNDAYSGNQLVAVTAAAPDDLWAVGEYDRRVRRYNGNGVLPSRVTALSEHWDGTAWNIGPAVMLT
jgi:hypothetical protein